MDYVRGVARAIIPRKLKDIVAVSVLASVLTYAGFNLVIQEPPKVQVHSETTYPAEAVRGGFLPLSFDVSFGAACAVTARRIIIGNDGVEYLAMEDRKEVEKDKRMQYVVRVPIAPAIPLGPAFIRSDFEYGCDFWSRYIRPIKQTGQLRAVKILPQPLSNYLGTSGECGLPPYFQRASVNVFRLNRDWEL